MRKNWDVRQAMRTLNIKPVPFDSIPEAMSDARGYSYWEKRRNKLAIRKGIRHPVFVAVHEMAHCTLGHTKMLAKQPRLAVPPVKYAMEVQAHSVALQVAQRLGFEYGPDFDPGFELKYLLGYMNLVSPMPDDVRKQTVAAVDRIVAAGLRDMPVSACRELAVAS
jgi:hypothetical protein